VNVSTKPTDIDAAFDRRKGQVRDLVALKEEIAAARAEVDRKVKTYNDKLEELSADGLTLKVLKELGLTRERVTKSGNGRRRGSRNSSSTPAAAAASPPSTATSAAPAFSGH
jgi:hypothetical protein